MQQAAEATDGVCSQCGAAQLRPETVRSAFWHGDRLVVVKDIPALVCGACHEQFYDDATVVLIDRLRGDGFPADRASGEIVAQVFSLTGRGVRPNGGDAS